MILNATYKGINCFGWETGQTYNITLNNNSMIVLKVDEKHRIPYRSVTDFLNDWDNIKHIKL